MQPLNESLLQAWMKLSSSIINRRVVAELSYKESQVCHILYHNYRTAPELKLTATDLCTQTKMLKSQMNRLLAGMESDGLIRRERNPADKRESYVYLREEALPRYLKEHDHVLNIVGAVCSALGEADTASLTALMLKAAATVTQMKEEP